MSPVKEFGQSALGKVAATAAVAAVLVMGKPMDASAAEGIAASIGQAVQDGTARPVNWLAADKTVTPGGGLAAKEGVKYDEDYDYQGGGMFGFDEDKVAGPAAKI